MRSRDFPNIPAMVAHYQANTMQVRLPFRVDAVLTAGRCKASPRCA